MTHIIGAGGGCFRKGTLIQQEHGVQTPIENLSVGDVVLAFDDMNNLHAVKVIKTHYHEIPQPILHVKYWGGELFATPNHWVVNQLGSFVELGSLTEDDALQDSFGHLRPILNKTLIGYEPVYNLTVETWHTFIANNIRVHNGGHRENYPVVTGAGGGGGKGGGGSARVPVESPNTLKSVQYANIIDLISEGQIGGLADGAKSIYLDGVPLQASDGSYNFTGFGYDLRVGTQVQEPLSAAIFGTKNTKINPASSSRVEYGDSKAQEVAIYDTRVRSVNLTIGIPGLTYQNPSTGDLSGNTVTFRIDVKSSGGSYVTYSEETISGKCTALYQKSYRVSLSRFNSGDYPLYIRVVRTKADNDSSNVRDDFYFQTYTEEIPEILSYPNSAVVNIFIDSEQFSNIPSRAYDIYGLIVRIPSNYNPYTRVYTGEWDGTFKLGWTNNPAWVYYDLILDPRYGLGDFISEDQIDKWALYNIAKYSDELVSNGIGGLEPRYTCNLVLNTREDAYRVLGNIASIFRGMSYWAGTEMHIVADMPKDPVMQFTAANVVDGLFNYSGSSLKTRHTVAQVTWNDPKDQYKQKIEYVEDPSSVAKWGLVQTDVIAVGCTSQAQAHRVGRWLLYTEQLETETISFKAGIESVCVAPGDIIQTSDPNRVGTRYGGRLLNVQSGTATLDGEPLTNGQYNISILLTYTENGTPTSKVETKLVTVNNNIFSINSYSAPPAINSIWVASPAGSYNESIKPELWRVISIKEEDNFTASIVALSYNPTKFDYIEKDLQLEERVISNIRYTKPETPKIVEKFEGYDPDGNYVFYNTNNDKTWFIEHLYLASPGVLSTAVTLSWTSSEPRFVIRWALSGSNDWQEYSTATNTYTIKPVEPNTYDVEIYAVNVLGNKSSPLKRTITILGKTAPPQSVLEFASEKTSSGILIYWASNKDSTKFAYPDLDLDGYAVKELYTQTLHPYTKSTNGTVEWKSKAELSTYLGISLTDSQYYNKLNEIWDSASYAEEGLVYNTSYLDISAKQGYNYFLVKAVDTSGNTSIIPSITAQQIAVPQTVTGIEARMDGSDLVVSWQRPTSDLAISHYLVTIDNISTKVYTEEFRRLAWFIDTKPFTISAVDISGNISSVVSKDITIVSNLAPNNLNASIIDDLSTEEVVNDSVKLDWVEVKPTGLSLPIVAYEVRSNLDWGLPNGLLSTAFSNIFVTKVTWNATKTLYVAGKTSIGTYTPYSSIDINIIPQGKPTNVSSKVVDNNVLLYWSAPTTGSLPIKEYLIKRGDVEATAEVVGVKSGNFTTVFETVSGTYTYWLAAVDTAGKTGSFQSVTATVSQPPDYVLQYDYDSTFSGTKTNATVYNNVLVLPVISTETWSTHFSSRSWTTPQNQIDAGYPVYIQPQASSGYYVEIMDYGTILKGNKVTITTSYINVVSGAVITYKIESSLDQSTWSLVSNSSSGFASNFRYIRVTITVTGGLIEVSNINIKIDSKLKTISGSVTTSTSGATVYLTDDASSTGNKIFKDVQAIIVTPAFNSGVPAVAIYDYVDVPEPYSFVIHLYRLSDGQEIAGTCSYTIRGV